MIKMAEVNDSQFGTVVLKSALPVLLECASPECIICKTMAERIQEAGKEYLSKMVFYRLNINENKKWQDFNVRVIPTLLYFKDGALVARQDNFPETEEIQKQIRAITARPIDSRSSNAELKTALDLEFLSAKFYKYVSGCAKNGKVREKFRVIHQESVLHRGMLEVKLQELTGEAYTPEAINKFEGLEMKPQSFSLMGALKMALKIEEKLLMFYKKLQKDKVLADGEFFKRLVKEETGHFKEIQREMKFMQDKELFSPLESPEYPSWLSKVFE